MTITNVMKTEVIAESCPHVHSLRPSFSALDLIDYVRSMIIYTTCVYFTAAGLSTFILIMNCHELHFILPSFHADLSYDNLSPHSRKNCLEDSYINQGVCRSSFHGAGLVCLHVGQFHRQKGEHDQI